jgi:hypothetical protein
MTAFKPGITFPSKPGMSRFHPTRPFAGAVINGSFGLEQIKIHEVAKRVRPDQPGESVDPTNPRAT